MVVLTQHTREELHLNITRLLACVDKKNRVFKTDSHIKKRMVDRFLKINDINHPQHRHHQVKGVKMARMWGRKDLGQSRTASFAPNAQIREKKGCKRRRVCF